MDEPWNDGSHLYLLNTEYKLPLGDTRILKFLDYVRDGVLPPSEDDTLLQKIDNRVKAIKGSKKVEEEFAMFEEEILSKGREEGFAIGLKEGQEAGRLAGRLDAIRQAAEYLPISELCRIFSTDEAEVKRAIERGEYTENEPPSGARRIISKDKLAAIVCLMLPKKGVILWQHVEDVRCRDRLRRHGLWVLGRIRSLFRAR